MDIFKYFSDNIAINYSYIASTCSILSLVFTIVVAYNLRVLEKSYNRKFQSIVKTQDLEKYCGKLKFCCIIAKDLKHESGNKSKNKKMEDLIFDADLILRQTRPILKGLKKYASKEERKRIKLFLKASNKFYKNKDIELIVSIHGELQEFIVYFKDHQKK